MGLRENRNVWRKPAVDHCFRLLLKTNEAKECNLSIICFRSHISLQRKKERGRNSFKKQRLYTSDFRRFMEICIELVFDLTLSLSLFHFLLLFFFERKIPTAKYGIHPLVQAWRRLQGEKNANNGFYVIICECKRSINLTDLKELTNEIDGMLNNWS